MDSWSEATNIVFVSLSGSSPHELNLAGHGFHWAGQKLYVKSYFVKGAAVTGGIPDDPVLNVTLHGEKLMPDVHVGMNRGFPLLLTGEHTVQHFERPVPFVPHLSHSPVVWKMCVTGKTGGDAVYDEIGIEFYLTH